MGLDLGALFREYHESLVRMLTRRTGDRGRAEELAQETFARAVGGTTNESTTVAVCGGAQSVARRRAQCGHA
jgi:predicted RNA polymerase sigma factor